MPGVASVICISRSAGAGGEQVGRLVSAELGLRYVDEEIVEKAARAVDVPVTLVADAETRKSLLARLLPQIGEDVAAVSMIGGITPPIDTAASNDYRELIKQAVREVAER